MTVATRNIKELIAQRRAELDSAKAIEARALSSGRDVSDAELRQIQAHLARADELRVPIEADQVANRERHEALKKLAEADAWGSQPQPGQQVRQVNPEHLSGPGSPGWGESSMRGRGRGRTYRELFGPPQGNDGFSSFGDWLKVLSSGLHHPGMVPAAGMVGSEGASGGYLVPEMFAAQMLDKAVEQTIIVSRADVRAMQFPTLKVAGLDDSSHSSHLFGGLTGSWISEAETIGPTDAKTRKIELVAKKLACLTKSSNELAEDAPGFERLLGDALVAGLSWYLDLACLVGTGAGQPLGILNDPALIQVAKETAPAQASGTIVYENLAKMLARLHPACLGNSIWIANPTTIPQLLGLTVRVQNAGGTDYVGGSHLPVLSQTGGQFAMLTRPVFFTEKLPALGSVGDILLVDPSQYILGLRRQVSIEKSQHVYFSSDEAAYRAILRADGQGKWSKPMTPKNGDTLSWCVALATRD